MEYVYTTHDIFCNCGLCYFNRGNKRICPGCGCLEDGSPDNKGDVDWLKDFMIFDWNKAATILKNTGVSEAYAKINTYKNPSTVLIYKDSKPVFNDCSSLFSNWAVPCLVINTLICSDDSESADIVNLELEECWLIKSDIPVDWGTQYRQICWPKSALNILSVDSNT